MAGIHGPVGVRRGTAIQDRNRHGGGSDSAGRASDAEPGSGVTWNVYAGTTPESLFLQNPAALNPTASWTAPSEGLFTSGPRPGTGQQPTFLSPAPRILLR